MRKNRVKGRERESNWGFLSPSYSRFMASVVFLKNPFGETKIKGTYNYGGFTK